ncbi:MAG: 3'(2'),5'-bisphosphate nucleotidase [Euryarchaeota archaeon]|nr:3'(2'),5'-bisphosphate nucleotidase [Euryarchaeota archaeon]
MTIVEEAVVALAIEAGLAIMEVYETTAEISFENKEDQSPLTQADLSAHEVIIAGLLSMDAEIPVVSEEGRVGNPLESELAWLVDPLDGTKEFIKRNGMFTVNIALMRRAGSRWKPIFGVVHAPVTETTWVGGEGLQAKRISSGSWEPISVRRDPIGVTRLVASGSHRNERDEEFANSLGRHELVRMGSSLKACSVADGSADLYPRFGPTSCWDIAAAHAVVESSGGLVIGPECKTLDYDLVDDVLNPFFLVSSSTNWNEIWVQNQD